MQRFLAKFRRNEKGAVTVDWVVIVAGIVALGITTMNLIGSETQDLANDTRSTIGSRLND